MVVPRVQIPSLMKYDFVKTKHRELITLLGKWRQRTKRSDCLSSPLVWLGGSSPPQKIRDWTGDINKTCPLPSGKFNKT